MTGFKLSRASHNELACVHPDLVRVVERAIELSTVDFAVHDGIRSVEEQRVYVARGVSKTMASRHLKGQDGYGHAVDLVPYVNGKLRWEWPPIYEIALAMRASAEECKVPIRWGGTWARLDGTTQEPSVLVHQYVDRRRAERKAAFIDGPHFELPAAIYP